jgi:hypothetical protein
MDHGAMRYANGGQYCLFSMWITLILPVFNVDNISVSWIMSFYNDCFSQPFVFSGGNISETIEGAKLDSPRNARACN